MSVMSHHVHVLTDNQRVKTTHNSEASQSTKQRHLNSTQQTVVSRSHRTHRVIYLDVFTQPCHPRGREYVFTQPCHSRDVFTQPCHPRGRIHSALPPTWCIHSALPPTWTSSLSPTTHVDVFTQPCQSRWGIIKINMSNICKNIAAAVQGAVNFYELVSMDSTVTSKETPPTSAKQLFTAAWETVCHCSRGQLQLS